MRTRSGFLAAAALAVTVTVAVTAGAGHGSRPQTAQMSPADPYDMAAARACVALDRFVNDIKKHQAIPADSQAFDQAVKALKAGHGPGSRWAVLATDLDDFLIDGRFQNIPELGRDGLAAGQQCATIPDDAKVAGGLT